MSCTRCEHDRLGADANGNDLREWELRRALCERFGKNHFAVTRRVFVPGRRTPAT